MRFHDSIILALAVFSSTVAAAWGGPTFAATTTSLKSNSETDCHGTSPPLKVFVLVGQSNMEGHGIVDSKNETTGEQLNATLAWLVENDPDEYGKLQTSDGNWTERSNVWIAYNREYYMDVRPVINQYGPLAPGYGGHEDQFHMGPELGFGWALGEAFENNEDCKENKRVEKENQIDDCPCAGQQILLIKTAWGGKSLAGDFRPPSSGNTTGLYYMSVLATVFRTLDNLETYFPSYQGSYDIAGFAWHQGWNDGCDEAMTAEYEFNMANLIRDLRVDLNVPNLPVSIGVSGMSGWDPNPRRDGIIAAQFAMMNATKYPEFAGNVEAVETRDYFRDPPPHSPGGQGYHWNNNCESYWLIGSSMGHAMLRLLGMEETAAATTASANHGEVDGIQNMLRGQTSMA